MEKSQGLIYLNPSLINLFEYLEEIKTDYEQLNFICEKEQIIPRMQIVFQEGLNRLEILQSSSFFSGTEILKNNAPILSHLKDNNAQIKYIINKIKGKEDNSSTITAEWRNSKLSDLKCTLKTSVKALKLLKIPYRESTILPTLNEVENELKIIISQLSAKKNVVRKNEKQSFLAKVEPCPLEDIDLQEIHAPPSLIRNAWNSCKATLKGQWSAVPISQEVTHIPELKQACEALKTEGRQLNMTTARVCLETLKHVLGDSLGYTLALLSETSTLKHCSFEDFQEIIKENLSTQHEPGTPYIIQIATGTESLLERDHTVVILIKDNQIEYYDPKGVPSDRRTFKDGRLLRDGLEEINQNHYNGTYKIVENGTPHQQDCHNCGAFVLFFLVHRLIRQKSLEDLINKSIPTNFIHYFREGFARYISENYSKIAPKVLGYDISTQETEELSLEFEIADENSLPPKQTNAGSGDSFIAIERPPPASQDEEFIHL